MVERANQNRSRERLPQTKKRRKRIEKHPGEQKGTGRHSIEIREKRWKEDAREKTEVRAIGQ